MTESHRAETTTTNLRDEIAMALDTGSTSESEPTDHPSDDELMLYCSDGAEPSAAEATAEHLTTCRTCLERVLEIDSFLAPPPEPSITTSIAALRSWRDLEARLRSSDWRRWRLVAAAASVLLVVGLGIALVNLIQEKHRLADQLANLDVPRPDVAILDLFPDSAVRQPGQLDSDPLPPDAELVVLLLNAPDLATCESYSADLVGTDGDVLWSGVLQRSPYDTFRLGVPRRWLETSGSVHLYGHGGDTESRRWLTTFPIRIGPADEEAP